MPRSAIVIGAGAERGVGGALCRRLAAEGLHVVAAGRTAEKLERLARASANAPGTIVPVVVDATEPSGILRAFDAAERAGGAPELVVYNAGVSHDYRPLLAMDDAFFEDLWRLCCFGGFVTGREAARRMLPAGGTLIFTGATASLRARPPFTAFASAKAALRAVAHGMAREFGKQGLHVAHVVVDGVIDGDELNSRYPQVKERVGTEGMLDVGAIAEAYWQLHRQPRSAWTLELDLRPYLESF
jgi:NAD(P)-dependent dehydrogenase (short-subunit alcohol dehydrogenase family)